MEHKPYVFHEYPKWIHPEGRKPCIVHNAEEEAEHMGAAPPVKAATVNVAVKASKPEPIAMSPEDVSGRVMAAVPPPWGDGSAPPAAAKKPRGTKGQKAKG